jgi:TonB family protein
MTKTVCMLGLLVLTTVTVLGQTVPQPDADGVYLPFGEVKPPKLVKAVAAVLPSEASPNGEKHISTLSVVIGADGIPASIEVMNSRRDPLDDAAVAAVKQSQFEPGTLAGKPVPVRIFVWVPFTDPDRPAIPEAGPLIQLKNMTMPKAVNTVEAEFSDEARRRHVSGTVMLAVLVTEDGKPAHVRVVAPVGAGLDEQAQKAVQQYRFKPATLEGIPVPVPIVVKVDFRLFERR